MQDVRGVKSFGSLVCILLQDKCESILFLETWIEVEYEARI